MEPEAQPHEGGRVGSTLIARLAAVPAVGQYARPYCLSPDGRLLAFQWYQGGDWQIFVKELPYGRARRVADLRDACSCPVFSPDGRFLYFARDDRGSERFDVYRYELATGRLENLLPDTPDFSPLPDFALSPDGTRIALLAAAGDGYAVSRHARRAMPGHARASPTSRVTLTRNPRRCGRRTGACWRSPWAPGGRTPP